MKGIEVRCPGLPGGTFIWILIGCIFKCMSLGNSRKYPYPTTDGFHVLSPPCLRKFQNVLPPMPSEFHNREPPSPSEILKAVRGMVWIFSGIAH